MMPHSSYSPDLGPCDHLLTDYVKRNLIDEANEKYLARAVFKMIKNIPEEEYKET